MKKQLLALMILPMIGACGFEPMYGASSKSEQGASTSLRAELAQVQISNIPNREGQYLRNALIDRFYTQGRPINPKYVLDVSDINETSYDLDITIRSDATRKQLTLTTAMTLKDAATGQVLVSRSLKSSGSFNVLESEFATRVSEQSTRENALDHLAQQIELQIGLYMDRAE